MKTKIFKTLLIALSLTFAMSVSSQEALQTEQKTASEAVVEIADMETESMTARSAVTSEQREQLMEINLDFAAKKKEAKDRNAPEQEFVIMYQERDGLIQSVLTVEQFRNWKEDPIEKERQERREQEEINQKK